MPIFWPKTKSKQVKIALSNTTPPLYCIHLDAVKRKRKLHTKSLPHKFESTPMLLLQEPFIHK